MLAQMIVFLIFGAVISQFCNKKAAIAMIISVSVLWFWVAKFWALMTLIWLTAGYLFGKRFLR